jgi:hypothetical protein
MNENLKNLIWTLAVISIIMGLILSFFPVVNLAAHATSSLWNDLIGSYILLGLILQNIGYIVLLKLRAKNIQELKKVIGDQ